MMIEMVSCLGKTLLKAYKCYNVHLRRFSQKQTRQEWICRGTSETHIFVTKKAYLYHCFICFAVEHNTQIKHIIQFYTLRLMHNH